MAKTARLSGAYFIAIAALLWSSDAIFRVRALGEIHPVWVVAIDHLIATLVLLPIVLWQHGSRAIKQSPKAWASALFAGAGGSAIATLFFTASFKYVNPSVSILVQKIQPIIVTLLAIIFLKERPARSFFIWGTLALFCVIYLAFPNLNFSFMRGVALTEQTGGLYALLASTLWAVTTVVGKILVTETPPLLATFWRYAFGLITLLGLAILSGESLPIDMITQWHVLKSLLYISLVSGLGAMLFYYRGLSQTTAAKATFTELLFPIGAIALNAIVLHAPLGAAQIFAGAILLYCVMRVQE